MREVVPSKRSACYLTTPEHTRTFVGQYIYIYTDKGELELTDSALHFVSKGGLRMDIPLSSIIEVRIDHYSRWAKPIRLDYIAVRYRHDGTERTVFLTPTVWWMTPVWETNKLVADWLASIEAARSALNPK
jgi:hypothetical protein